MTNKNILRSIAVILLIYPLAWALDNSLTSALKAEVKMSEIMRSQRDVARGKLKRIKAGQVCIKALDDDIFITLDEVRTSKGMHLNKDETVCAGFINMAVSCQ